MLGLLTQTLASLLAHAGEVHDVPDLTWQWGAEPLAVISLALTAILYSLGICRLWRSAGAGHGIRRWEAGCFIAGWVALLIALVSPLHPWGRYLFAAHMTQHEILMLIAAPLLVLGRPIVAFLWAIPRRGSQRLVRITNAAPWQRAWRFISNAFAAWLIHGVVLWIWHIPALFEATGRSELVHILQHLSFLLSALLFWWALMQGRQHAIGYGLAVLYMFTTALHSGLLGALLTFARTLWYPSYEETAPAWGLTPLQDQQLGGLIMWIPAGVVYIIAALALMAAWMRESERRVAQRESRACGILTPLTPQREPT